MPDVTVCRSCRSSNIRTFLRLGDMPLPDALRRAEQLGAPEARYPLDVAFCDDCALVQVLADVPAHEMFVDNYLYFSSFSDHLLRHAREHAFNLIERRGLGSDSLVVELASNDGYLLRNFVERGVPVLGIDPAPGQADAAEAAGVPTLREFFGAELARRLVSEGKQADVVIANNVMAHVPDLNSFVEGISILLKEDGLLTVENPYVRDLVDKCEFDTIYHEHVCYYSCTAVDALFRRHGLYLNHVEYFPDLHGGTLRWHAGKTEARSEAVLAYLAEERARGLDTFAFYEDFGASVAGLRGDLVGLLRDLKLQGKSIAAYGAAAKGSTLINYAGLGPDFLDFVVDRNVHKQGLYMPGLDIPIRDTSALIEARPDYTLILAWNFEREIVEQQSAYLEAGGRFIVPVPRPRIVGGVADVVHA